MDFKKNIREFFLKKSNKYYSREYFSQESYYEKLRDKYINASSYYSLINATQNKLNIVSQKLISFNDNKFENITKEDIFKQYGSPNYQIVTNKKLNTELLFYRLLIGGYRVKLELHLNNNHLFIFTYIFSHLRVSEKHKIIKLIEKKYINQQGFDYDNNVIIDSNKSIINITDSIDLTINYICCISSAFFQNIENIIDNQKINSKKKEKRITIELYKKL